MFNNSSIMALVGKINDLSVRLIEVDRPTQEAICSSFSDSSAEFLVSENVVPFDGSYKPNDDEVLSICDFNMPVMIKNAIKNPLGLQSLDAGNDVAAAPIIRAIFVGERLETATEETFTISFQRFKKEQYLSTKKFNLYFDRDTFIRENRWGIGINENTDCIFINSELRFYSYYFTKQIFDLSEYYRSATESDIQKFRSFPLLKFTDSDQFQSMADDAWIRRKIASINDSKVLEKNNVKRIGKLAEQCGFVIEIKNDRLIIPLDKSKVKEILGFLDDEVYKGTFSGETFITNSKRKI